MISADVINLDINLSKLDKTKFFTDKTGDTHVKVNIRQRREPDRFGNDLTVSYHKTKEERDAKTPLVYAPCFARTVHFEDFGATAPQEPKPQKQEEERDDLPF